MLHMLHMLWVLFEWVLRAVSGLIFLTCFIVWLCDDRRGRPHR